MDAILADAGLADADIADEVRRSFIEGFERLAEVVGHDLDAVKSYMAVGLFSDVAMAIRLPREYWPTLPAG